MAQMNADMMGAIAHGNRQFACCFNLAGSGLIGIKMMGRIGFPAIARGKTGQMKGILAALISQGQFQLHVL